jgi:hypothetical protein
VKKNGKRERIWKRFLVGFWTRERYGNGQPLSILQEFPVASQKVVDRDVWCNGSSSRDVPHAILWLSVFLREVDKIK